MKAVQLRPLAESHKVSASFFFIALFFIEKLWYFIIRMLEELENKRILILGFGKEGQDNFRFLRKLFPKKVLGVGDRLKLSELSDQAKKIASSATRWRGEVKWHLGGNYLKALKDYDVIIKSPGIPIHLPEVEKAFKQNKITSQTEIFFSAFAPRKGSYGGPSVAYGEGGDNCPGKIIGITGTKGKSTTASLIYQILKACPEQSRRVYLVGNIGKPVLNLLFSATPKDIYIYELSSHQLYNLKKSPHIAVLLNIYPEHLDYYRSFKEYVNTKANIARYQTKNDYLVYNSGDKIVREIAEKSKTESRDSGTKVKKRTKFSSPAKKIPIKGKYYELDENAARAVGRIFKIPSKIIEKAIKEFKPLPHRLELVGTFKGITFYNDALATIPEAAMAAMEALGDKVETIMLGGFERNIDFQNLAKKVLKSKIKNVILFPTTGEKIWKAIIKQTQGRGVPRPFFVDRAKRTKFSSSTSPRYGGAQYMRDAVKLAYQHTKKGKICLLSTASPSFSIFKDYKEKGNLFKKYVKFFGGQ